MSRKQSKKFRQTENMKLKVHDNLQQNKRKWASKSLPPLKMVATSYHDRYGYDDTAFQFLTDMMSAK